MVSKKNIILIVVFLLGLGTSKSVFCDDAFNLIVLHIEKGDLDSIKKIFDEIKTDEEKQKLVNQVNDNDKNLLSLACYKSTNKKIVEYFLQYSTKETINKRDKFGLTALFVAAVIQDLTILELFIKKGGNVNIIVDDNESLIYRCCDNNEYAKVEFLINNGADINLVTSKGISCLLSAIDGNNLPMVRLFLNNNAIVNNSCFEYAKDKPEIIKLLNKSLKNESVELLEKNKKLILILPLEPGCQANQTNDYIWVNYIKHYECPMFTIKDFKDFNALKDFKEKREFIKKLEEKFWVDGEKVNDNGKKVNVDKYMTKEEHEMVLKVIMTKEEPEMVCEKI